MDKQYMACNLKARSFALLTVAIFGFNFGVKFGARCFLELNLHKPITPFLDLALHYNKEVWLGLFALKQSSNIVALITTAGFVFLFATIWNLFFTASWLERIGAALIIGGTISNLADRVFNGNGVDYLDLHIGGSDWASFNFEEIEVTLGLALLLLMLLDGPRTKFNG